MTITLRIVVSYNSEDYCGDDPTDLRNHVADIQKQLDESEDAREYLADYILDEFPLDMEED